ncbi:hypothetical protein [Nonlabens sp.]|uniref:hypothetical protein n=1 Tax=Nonlabens sp. TaxID=1888209 RepID=UPI003F6A4C3F
MKLLKLATIMLLGLLALTSNAQQHQDEHHESNGDGSGFRIAGIIGHTLVNNEGMDNVFVPSWGLDIEYWFNHKWGIGMHNDMEIETFIIKNSENEEVERVNPLVFTIDALYQFGGGFVVTLGPGIELEKNESFYLMRVGIEYEQDINKSLYILPNLFLDQRFDGYHTWNIGLGVGLKL